MSITARTATPAIPRGRPINARLIAGRTALLLAGALLALAAGAQQTEFRTAFRVKYIADGAVYLDGGRIAGLVEGQKLVVKRLAPSLLGNEDSEVKAPRIIAELEVVSVADTSAVCEVRSANHPLRVGDMAHLTQADVQAVSRRREAAAGRKYPQLIAFTVGDPLDEEAREAVPRPPLPEINRARGRIGVEYSATAGRGDSTLGSRQVGVVLRMDMTRIAGTHWNFSGYWRGRLNSRSGGSQPQTLNDLLSRTYHLGLIYSNPNSPWVAGIGRLYLPWASSLSALDGGYLARRYGKSATLGVFAGSTPDPTSWNYNPDRRIAGTFANFEGGSFDSIHYTATVGVAVSTLLWRADRRFLFAENGFFFKRNISIYHSLEADAPKTTNQSGRPVETSAAVTRSNLTLRFQPHHRLSLDLNHNYFRDLPTFDTRLVGTGLVDKLLFQGLSGSFRIELPKRIAVYSSLGRSSRTDDARDAWNQLYGLTLGEIWGTGIRADLRYSKFDSSFGRGGYRALSLSRHFGETLRWEVQTGFQNFFSPVSPGRRGQFVNTTFDWFLGHQFFFEGGYTWQRGDTQNYDQWFVVLGRRF